MSPRTFYVNADFDLSLRPRLAARRAQSRQVRELSTQALLGSRSRDAALLRVGVPEEFPAYLAACGIETPRILRHPDIDPETHFDPFGWNEEAVALQHGHRTPAPHPELACVRRVNARSFGRALETELDPASPPLVLVTSVSELETFLKSQPSAQGWVVKAEHGNAGLANRRMPAGPLSPIDRRWVAARLAEDDRVVVEPWVDRERDWSLVFRVPFDARTFRIHEAIYTRDGGLVGTLFDPAGKPPGAPSEHFEETARQIAARLVSEGYFGPVCVDALSYRAGDSRRLRALVDLNGRRAMSDPAWRLWRHVAPERTMLYRFFRLDKLVLPSDVRSVITALGDQGYKRETKSGILLGSPFRVHDDGAWRPPTKLAVLFLGPDREDVVGREQWFRRRFEK